MVKRQKDYFSTQEDANFPSVAVSTIQQRRLYEKRISNLSMGVQLLMAKNGYEDMIKIGSTSPDVIKADFMMPI